MFLYTNTLSALTVSYSRLNLTASVGVIFSSSVDLTLQLYFKEYEPIVTFTSEESVTSTYVKEHYSGPKCIIIDTDDLDHWRHEGLRRWLIHLYKHIPDKVEEFDLLYAGILDFYKKIPEWTVVIDSAQFRNLKDASLLKGKVIVLRTSAQECYDRCVARYKKKHPNSSISMVEEYNERKRI